MDSFPSNARQPQQKPEPAKKASEDKHITPVVTNGVVRRKKPVGKRLVETFFGGSVSGAWSTVVVDVLIPAAKDMIVDAAIQGMERTVFGETRSNGRRGASSYGSRGTYGSAPTPYNRYASYNQNGTRNDPPRPSISDRGRQSHDFAEIVLQSRVEAEEVLGNMIDLIEKYGQVSVGEMYELVGTSSTWVDNKWGWKHLGDAYPSHVKNGYLLNFPRPEPLD
jgi:hypothetical protein